MILRGSCVLCCSFVLPGGFTPERGGGTQGKPGEGEGTRSGDRGGLLGLAVLSGGST